MTDPEQEDLSPQLVDAPDWAIQAVRDIRRMSRGDFCSAGANCGECVRAVAPKHARQAPERVRYDTHAETRGGRGIEGMIIIIAHARHDQGPFSAEYSAHGGDKA
jgi:hypothetical protein